MSSFCSIIVVGFIFFFVKTSHCPKLYFQNFKVLQVPVSTEKFPTSTQTFFSYRLFKKTFPSYVYTVRPYILIAQRSIVSHPCTTIMTCCPLWASASRNNVSPDCDSIMPICIPASSPVMSTSHVGLHRHNCRHVCFAAIQ